MAHLALLQMEELLVVALLTESNKSASATHSPPEGRSWTSMSDVYRRMHDRRIYCKPNIDTSTFFEAAHDRRSVLDLYTPVLFI